MHIYLNGDALPVSKQITVTALVQQLDLANQRFAVEVNEELVPRSGFDDFQLQPGDRVEIVQAIGGG